MDSLEPIVIAEISANHLGSLPRALQLIESAKNAGAKYVKFQHFLPDTITVKGEHADLIIGGESQWAGRSLWDLYGEAAMPWEWTATLIEHCDKVGIKWMSTPFDDTAVTFLENFSPDFYKVASFEIVDLPLIRRIAATGKPMILSTGMALESEIDAAIEAALGSGASDLILLRTNSGYPAPVSEMDLAAIPYMLKKWGLRVGLSDHTLGATSAIAATALGATIFEKHLTLSREDGGPDAAFSSEPNELKDYCEKISECYSALGGIRFGPSASEEKNLIFRPSLRATRDIAAGEHLSASNMDSRRPSGGLAPDDFDRVCGRRLKTSVKQGDPISEGIIEV